MPSTFNWKPVLLAGLMVSLGQFSMGLIMPSLPWIAQDFSITSEQAQRLVSFYLLGFGPSQLLYGPLSDALGRKPILVFGLLLSLIGLTIAILNAESFNLLVLGRFIQGLGAGVGAVLARASLRDSYDHNDLAKALSFVTIAASFSPIVAPVLGGFINEHLGWLAVFITLFTYVLTVLVLLVFMFSETMNNRQRVPNVAKILGTYAELIRSKYFLSFALIGWFNFSLIITTVSVMPFIMQIQIGMSSDEYALWALIPALGLLIGGTVCNRIRPKFGTKKTMKIGPILHLSSAIWFIFAPIEPMAMMFGQLLLTIGNGITFPCAQTMLLMPYKNRAGSVAALSGGGQMTIAALVSMLLMTLGITHAWHLGITIFVIAIMSATSMYIGFKHSPNQD